MILYCCICLFVDNDLEEDNEATTIINGQAVCYDHLGYVQGDRFSDALRAARSENR